uniref:Uncharacterized protein n=1 Tax=Geospiza parvula TaxID=87175 RepID=A0A8C3MAR3_GEOPR
DFGCCTAPALQLPREPRLWAGTLCPAPQEHHSRAVQAQSAAERWAGSIPPLLLPRHLWASAEPTCPAPQPGHTRLCQSQAEFSLLRAPLSSPGTDFTSMAEICHCFRREPLQNWEGYL